MRRNTNTHTLYSKRKKKKGKKSERKEKAGKESEKATKTQNKNDHTPTQILPRPHLPQSCDSPCNGVRARSLPSAATASRTGVDAATTLSAWQQIASCSLRCRGRPRRTSSREKRLKIFGRARRYDSTACSEKEKKSPKSIQLALQKGETVWRRFYVGVSYSIPSKRSSTTCPILCFIHHNQSINQNRSQRNNKTRRYFRVPIIFRFVVKPSKHVGTKTVVVHDTR